MLSEEKARLVIAQELAELGWHWMSWRLSGAGEVME